MPFEVLPGFLDFPGAVFPEDGKQEPGLHEILAGLCLKGAFALPGDDQLVQSVAGRVRQIDDDGVRAREQDGLLDVFLANTP